MRVLARGAGQADRQPAEASGLAPSRKRGPADVRHGSRVGKGEVPPAAAKRGKGARRSRERPSCGAHVRAETFFPPGV
jgi:hypothetical protein